MIKRYFFQKDTDPDYLPVFCWPHIYFFDIF